MEKVFERAVSASAENELRKLRNESAKKKEKEEEAAAQDFLCVF